MKKIVAWIFQFKWYLLFAGSVMAFKVYSDYNNINIWPSRNETQADEEQTSGSRNYFYRGRGIHHK